MFYWAIVELVDLLWLFLGEGIFGISIPFCQMDRVTSNWQMRNFGAVSNEMHAEVYRTLANLSRQTLVYKQEKTACRKAVCMTAQHNHKRSRLTEYFGIVKNFGLQEQKIKRNLPLTGGF